MYNSEGKVCSVHPTILRPCSICGTPSEQVGGVQSSTLPDNTVINQKNYQAETAIPYNTPAANHPKHDSMVHFAERLGLNEHWDDLRDRVLPPPLYPKIT